MTLILSAWTVIVMILFIGIVAWAWSGKNKNRFDEAARIPFDEGGLENPEGQEDG